jgi:ethanolamine utilization microcompartment shell protein EutL
VIANVDSALLDAMKLEKRYRSIGILGAVLARRSAHHGGG